MNRADRKRNEQTCRICGVRLMNKEQTYCGKCAKEYKNKKAKQTTILMIVVTLAACAAIYFVQQTGSTSNMRLLYYALIAVAASGAYAWFKRKN